MGTPAGNRGRPAVSRQPLPRAALAASPACAAAGPPHGAVCPQAPAGAYSRRDRGAAAEQEDAVTNGLILLVFLAALAAFGWTRLRRRAGLPVTGKTYLTVIVGFVLVVLAMWAAATH